eukprot:5208279-Amphidinium_carterae.1
MKALSTKTGKGSLRLLYLTPERLAKSKLVLSMLEQIYSAGRLGWPLTAKVDCFSVTRSTSPNISNINNNNANVVHHAGPYSFQ